ncbi:transcription termination factor 5, mitochondrial-like isoform X2 [Portunus trituberculatus]|nr:transcription termination factor 5, mitochondrial-like isoform X2 [Portunus trituberculatus]
MRTMKNVLGLEATVMLKSVCSSSKVFWKKNALRLQALQFAHHFSSQTETLHNLNDESSSEKAVRTYHQRAYEKLSTAEEANVEFHSANRIIQPTVHVEMIQQYFNVGKTTAYRMLEKDKRLKACGVHNLARNMNTLQENSVDPVNVRKNMALLYRCPLTTEHNIAVMKELGLNDLKAEYIIQAIKLFKSSVAMIKKWGLLPEHYDPMETLTSLEIPDHVLNSVKFDWSNHLTLAQLHQKLSIVYLSWRLNCSEKEVSKLQQTYRLAKKSMKLQQKIFDQLEHEWNIDIQKIRLNGYLLTCSPTNVYLIDNKVKQIAGISIKEYVGMTPRILTIPYHQLLQVDKILSKLDLPEKSLKTLPRICTLHPDTLEERLNELRQIPEFHALQSHPRMLHLIYYHKKVSSRLDQLQQVKSTSALPSLNTLSGTKKIFDKYMTVGDLRQNKRDVIMLLSKHMNVKPNVIRKHLHDQCWGSQTNVVNVQRNILTLKEVGFTEEQLMAGLDVLLYPPDLLHDQLALLPKRPQVQPFSEYKSNVNVLQMLLYFMEKNVSLTSLS